MKEKEVLDYVFLSMPELEKCRTNIIKAYQYISVYGQLQIKNEVEDKKHIIGEVISIIEHQRDIYEKKFNIIKKISSDKKISEHIKYLINKLEAFLENIYNVLNAYIISLKKIRNETKYSEHNEEIKSLNRRYMELSADLQGYISTIFSKHQQAA